MTMHPLFRTAVDWIERGRVPDALTRWGIRRACEFRLRENSRGDCEQEQARATKLFEELSAGDVAIETDAANEQHYELPARFFELCLGPHRKYSSCYWPDGCTTLADAERHALEATCERADLKDGQRILELGCGWGSLTLFMADKYRNAKIVGISNSHSQRESILSRAKERGLDNIEIRTLDVNDLTLDERFDRAVSVEMFEHVRNHGPLLEKVANALEDDGRLFVHIFCHRSVPYTFETTSDQDWIGRHFFTGGLMPSDDWLLHFPEHLQLEERWRWSGTHYEKTSNAWLENLDRNTEEVMEIFREVYGDDAGKWLNRWRVFYLACAELFGFANGQEWWVSHYRFAPARSVVRGELSTSDKRDATSD